MKQCPKCHQPFDYDLLKFCRFDGSRLVSVTPDEAITVRFPTVQRAHGNMQDEAHVSGRKDNTPRAARS